MINNFEWKPIPINIPNNNYNTNLSSTSNLIYDFLSSINPNNKKEELIENSSIPREQVITNNNIPNSSSNNPLSLFSALDKYEGAGGYDTLYNHSQNNRFKGIKVSQMSIGDLKRFSDPRNGEYGRYVASNNNGVIATPMGRGQIVGTKLREMQAKMGLSDNTIFSPELQNRMINTIAKERIAGKNNIDARKALTQEWVGLRNMPSSALDSIIQNIRIGNI